MSQINVLLAQVVLIILFFIAFFNLLVPAPTNGEDGAKLDLYRFFQYDKIRNEAEIAGVNLTRREFISIILLSVGSGIIVSIMFNNLLYIIVGIISGFYVPRYFVVRNKRRKRLSLFTNLPEALSMINSRTLSLGYVRAVEASYNDMAKDVRPYFEDFIQSINATIPFNQAMMNLAAQIRFKKFQEYVAQVIMAKDAGFKDVAVENIADQINLFREDLRAVEQIKLESRAEKRNVFMVVGINMALPIILNILNPRYYTLFFHTFLGQFLLFFTFITCIFVILKGGEVLTLDLDKI